MYVSPDQTAELTLENIEFETLDNLAYRKPSARAINWTLPGFLGKVRIQTAFGALPVEALRVNDPILTTTGRSLLVERISRIGLDRDFLIRHPEAQPILIPMNALASGLPKLDMHVSPGQEMTVEIEGVPHQRLKATDILGFNSVVREPRGALTYYSIELSEPAFIYAEGIPVFIPAKPRSLHDEDEDEEANGVTEDL